MELWPVIKLNSLPKWDSKSAAEDMRAASLILPSQPNKSSHALEIGTALTLRA